MWLNALVLAGVIILLASPGGSASAKETASAYTKIDADRCSHTRGTEVEDYGSWRCKGYAGIGVRLSANDQRMHVSFGPRAATEIAARETLAPFNDFYKRVIEWRLEKQQDGKARPFAAIARWNVQTAADVLGPHAKASGRVLVVTRLGPGGVCHVGYVDALANANANDLAREIADKSARAFKCGKDKPVILGKVEPGNGVTKY
jgi:hypothetical protein